MTTALQIARSGLDALDQRMKTISNNLANVSTTGFKKDRASFASLMYQDDRNPGAASGADTQYATGLGTGTGVRVVGTERMHSQGTLQTTDNALDLAIDGAGFFAVQLNDGTVGYTRDGGFKLSANGEMVTASGLRLAQPLTIPDGAQQITISPDGIVTAAVAGQAAPVEVGQLQLTRFLNPAGLMPVGDNLYRETTGSGPPTLGVAGQAGMGNIRQGMLEGSNVSTVQELVDMIETQRAYEINAKVINAADEMSRYVVQNV
ncbi:flagellar basal-body rod protein FlgG [Sandarakinorhabdus limnophila]|uniref:flagellar basal-body rod protein FlgG n=1 Tax=Sandarakinorhabdus limnophila TaxID=210512 RepID=UPI0026F2C2CE|nr:flagellar basal-body rod protein FlgG [Sandarakinorhabdus limnophila]MCM0033965.1 flagellar basal-body rod protein FlgG [Sandarakinorhabdus limnophila]